jgi:hypothetical protein
MNASDWLTATGHPVVGRGGRPLNPRLLDNLITKARPAKSAALAREARQSILRTVRLCGEVDDVLSRTLRRRGGGAAVRDTTIAQQSAPGAAGAAARLRHSIAVQRARRI